MASRNLDEALARLDDAMHSMNRHLNPFFTRHAPVPFPPTSKSPPVPHQATFAPATPWFAPSPFEDPVGALFKLTQTGSVLTYLLEFEALASRIIGLPGTFLLPCFISGLQPEIRRTVQAHQPTTVDQAAGLAKLLEQQTSSRPRTPPLVAPPSAPLVPPHIATLPPLLPSPPRPPQAPTISCLTPEELASRHEHGLCLTGEEKLHGGRREVSRVLPFIVVNEEPTDPLGPNIKHPDPQLPTPGSTGLDPKPIPDPDPKPTPDPRPKPTHDPAAHPTPKPDPAQIGLKSLSGDFTPGILRLAGLLSGIRVVLLVVGRSPHTFFQPPLSISLSLPCWTAPTLFRVMFLPHGYFVELQVRRNEPWDPGIAFGSCSLNAQHLEDKVFLMRAGNDRIPEIGNKEAGTEKAMVTISKPEV